jgi:hypothetical protein
LTLDDIDVIPQTAPTLSGQFASRIGVVNKIDFSVIPLRRNNKLKNQIERRKNSLQEYYLLKVLFYF